MKEIAVNKKVFHDYELFDKYEAGLVLLGTEIKSIRRGKVQLKESFVSFVNGEAYIKGMNIAQYDFGNRFNHDEFRERKLLLHRQQINKLAAKVKIQGFTVVPLRLYLQDGRAKLEIALARGKSLYDKREDDKVKTMERDARKAMMRY